MNFEFNVGGDISFSADMGYRPAPPAPPAEIKAMNAYVLINSAGQAVIGNIEVLEV
jgi:hypothetical protein